MSRERACSGENAGFVCAVRGTCWRYAGQEKAGGPAGPLQAGIRPTSSTPTLRDYLECPDRIPGS